MRACVCSFIMICVELIIKLVKVRLFSFTIISVELLIEIVKLKLVLHEDSETEIMCVFFYHYFCRAIHQIIKLPPDFQFTSSTRHSITSMVCRFMVLVGAKLASMLEDPLYSLRPEPLI